MSTLDNQREANVMAITRAVNSPNKGHWTGFALVSQLNLYVVQWYKASPSDKATSVSG